MFVVKDLSVLEKYGFSNLKEINELGFHVFELLVERSEKIVLKDSLLKDVLWKKDIVNTIRLTVNPFGAQVENEMILTPVGKIDSSSFLLVCSDAIIRCNYNRNSLVFQESFCKELRLMRRFIPMLKGRGFLGEIG